LIPFISKLDINLFETTNPNRSVKMSTIKLSLKTSHCNISISMLA